MKTKAILFTGVNKHLINSAFTLCRQHPHKAWDIWKYNITVHNMPIKFDISESSRNWIIANDITMSV